MPVHACQENGKKGWKWGGSGKCYTYESESGSVAAHAKATAQGQAAYAHGYTRSEDMNIIENKLPDIKPNEDEQTYVSRCIAFETAHTTHDRSPEQVQRMCYEKYRNRNKSDEYLNKLSTSFERLSISLESLKKNLITRP
jgi:hypothetical protein